jgi:hypothetical protein
MEITCLTCPIHVTLYAGARYPVPLSQDDFATWEELVKSLEGLIALESGAPRGSPVGAQKEGLYAIAPHRLREPYRNEENAYEVTLAVIDVDRCDLDKLLQRIDELDIAAVVYGSPSDDESAAERRVRVISPVTRAILPEECKHVRYAFAEMLGIGPGVGVEGAQEAAKLFFIGKLHDASDRLWVEATGRSLDVDELATRPLAANWSSRGGDSFRGGESVSGDDAAYQRAVVIAQRMPASISHHGGDRAVFHCAREIATQLGEDAVAIEKVLTEVFNPRCIPPWDQAKLHHETCQAVEEQAKPESRLVRRREQSKAEAEARGDFYSPAEKEGAPDSDPWDNPLRFDGEDDPLVYLCPGLKIAPSDGKITVIAGQPGAAKGPTANHLAVCFALGLRAFGQFQCRACRVAILDFEGARLTRRRCRRLARGLGVDPAELQDRLFIFDGNTLGNFSEEYALGRLRAWAETWGVDVIIVDSYMSAMMSSGLEPNSPQYASLAKELGALGKCVIVVAHANKASSKEDRQPRLSDIAYTGAFSAMAQTALVLHYPDPADKNVVEIGCARAPEEGFASFLVRFQGGKDDPLKVVVTNASADDGGPRQSRETKAYCEAEARANKALDTILFALRNTIGYHQGASTTKLKSHTKISSADWAAALMQGQRQGLIEMATLPSETTVTVRLTDKGGAKPQPGRYTLPVPGERASAS